MNKLQVRNIFLLFVTSVIWGCAFVAQSIGMQYIEPFTFNAVRSLIGCIFLVGYLCIVELVKKATHKRKVYSVKKEDKRVLWTGGLLCGGIMFLAVNLQQFGILYASVGKAGFITALYIVIVPLIGIGMGKQQGKKIWISVGLGLMGLYLLCMKADSAVLGLGDVYLILCALLFSIHILVIDHYTQRINGVKLSCIQFMVCGVLSVMMMLLLEEPSTSAILNAYQPILYSGILSSGVAYTFQIVGQKGVNPVVASLILSLESVVAALAGWFILKEVLTKRELFGCLITFIAILLAQIPDSFFQKIKEKAIMLGKKQRAEIE